MAQTYSFVEGDTGSKLRVTCRDNITRLPIDLTGATVVLKWNRPTDQVAMSRTMTIVSPAISGIAEYLFLAGELVPGLMKMEVKITDASGRILHTLQVMEEWVRAKLVA